MYSREEYLDTRHWLQTPGECQVGPRRVEPWIREGGGEMDNLEAYDQERDRTPRIREEKDTLRAVVPYPE